MLTNISRSKLILYSTTILAAATIIPQICDNDPDWKGPRGQIVHQMPTGVEKRSIDGETYYFYNQVHYRKYTGGYIAVDSPKPNSASPAHEDRA